MYLFIKQAAVTLLPERVAGAIKARRWWKSHRRFVKLHGLSDAADKYIKRHGTTVLHGPFQGMRYSEECISTRGGVACLIGSYEMELHPWLSTVTPGRYDRLLDIGAAEGYYAVGLALRGATRIDAYEPDPGSRRFCREMASLNGVSSLMTLHAWCTPASLRKLHGQRCFIFSDCEGFELKLFQKDVIGSLAHSDLIIEVHPVHDGDTGGELAKRFEGSHELQFVPFVRRNVAQYPEVECLGPDYADKVVNEMGRHHTSRWLVALAKGGR